MRGRPLRWWNARRVRRRAGVCDEFRWLLRWSLSWGPTRATGRCRSRRFLYRWRRSVSRRGIRRHHAEKLSWRWDRNRPLRPKEPGCFFVCLGRNEEERRFLLERASRWLLDKAEAETS